MATQSVTVEAGEVTVGVTGGRDPAVVLEGGGSINEAADPVITGAQLAGMVVMVKVTPLSVKPGKKTVDVLVSIVSVIIVVVVSVAPVVVVIIENCEQVSQSVNSGPP